ncbi:4-(cytidine 5'-diphospho)-2-C-methyl-D-erythritol kinase [soil metagenome]
MITFPNAKINLGLNIVEKRKDGFHNIETIFYPVGWKDILEIVPAEKKINRKSDVQFHSSGIKITGGVQKNSCVKAYYLLKEKYGLPPVEMHLHKNIPAGAGLGGGSSDAAFSLLTLNKIFKLQIQDDEMEKLATSIGADCSFFLRNKPVFAKGIGDEFEEIKLDLSNYSFVIIKPDVHVNTALAYKNVIPKQPEISSREVIISPVNEWKNNLVNDFEVSVFKKYPAIAHIKEQLYEMGAVYASMSGSGSAVFGLFDEVVDLAGKFGGYRVWTD